MKRPNSISSIDYYLTSPSQLTMHHKTLRVFLACLPLEI